MVLCFLFFKFSKVASEFARSESIHFSLKLSLAPLLEAKFINKTLRLTLETE